MKSSIEVRIWTGFGVAFLLLLVLAISSYRSTRAARESASGVEHSQRVLDGLSNVMIDVIDGESAVRDFALLGSEADLSRRRSDDQDTDRWMQELRTLVADDAVQQRSMDTLVSFVNQSLSFLTTVSEARRSKGQAGAEDLLKSSRSQKLIADTQTLYAEMEKHEREVLLARRAAAESEARTAVLTDLGVALLALVVLSAAAFFIVRSVGQTLRANAEAIKASLRGHAEMLKTASTQLSASSEEHRRSVAEQSAAVNETTATAAELSASQKQIIQTAAAVAHAGDKATAAIEAGQGALANTLLGLTEIRKKTEATSQRILALSDKSQQVGRIVSTIKDITDQINLLALNAAIEAARAGEQGRGFAVVAGEVRKLAEQTKKSTEDITQLVTDMQNSTSQVVLATEETTKSAEAGNVMAVNAGAVFDNIAHLMGETADAIKQIHIGCQQQDSATGQIASAMEQINVGMKQTVAAVEQTVASAAGLKDTATQLQEMVVR